MTKDGNSSLCVGTAATIQEAAHNLRAERLMAPCRQIAESRGIDTGIEHNRSAFGAKGANPTGYGDSSAIGSGDRGTGNMVVPEPIDDAVKDRLIGVDSRPRGNTYKLCKQTDDRSLQFVSGRLEVAQYQTRLHPIRPRQT
jgi:hypothetical protein